MEIINNYHFQKICLVVGIVVFVFVQYWHNKIHKKIEEKNKLKTKWDL